MQRLRSSGLSRVAIITESAGLPIDYPLNPDEADGFRVRRVNGTLPVYTGRDIAYDERRYAFRIAVVKASKVALL